MIQLKVLTGESSAVDTESSSDVSLVEVFSLNHKVPDDLVELAVLVTLGFLFLRQLYEAVNCFRNCLHKESSYLSLEEHLR